MSALKTESLPNEGVRSRGEHEQRSLLNHADATILHAVVKIDALASVSFPAQFSSSFLIFASPKSTKANVDEILMLYSAIIVGFLLFLQKRAKKVY